MKTDIAIVGAGPAGLFAAREIVKRSKLQVTVIEQGKDVEERACPVMMLYKLCTRCSPCGILCGVGGSGMFSGGILNLRPDIGGNLLEFVDKREALSIIREIDEAFIQYGAPKRIYRGSRARVRTLERKAAAIGIQFIPIPQRFIGTDHACKVIKSFKEDLNKMGVKFLLNKRVKHIEKGKLLLQNGDLTYRYAIVAPGRSGAEWLTKEVTILGIPTKYEPIDIGVRVEVPSIIMDPIIEISRDPKFHIRTKTYDDFVRTFCVNHNGFVVQEVYKEFVGVNGHSFVKRKSNNTNFALLVKMALTQPLENTSLYGQTIAVQATTLGGGKPILQSLGDLLKGRRSTWSRIERGNVKPTLRNVTPGDISMAMPHRIVTDIVEALEKLDQVIPGTLSPSTLLYAPEIKFPANRVLVKKNMETTIDGLYVAGDGAGLSRGIVTAAATGIIAARGILEKEGITASESF